MFEFPLPKFICWSPNSQHGYDWRWDSLRSKVKWDYKGPDLIGRVLQAKTPEGALSVLTQWEEVMWGHSRKVVVWKPEREPSAQLCLTFWNSMDCSTPGLPVHCQLPEFTQTHAHRVGDAIQPSHPDIPVSCLQSFPASGSFQMSQFFTSDGQIIAISASASVLPMNIQNWFPLGWIDWISLHSKGLSGVFSNTTVQKHQFFGTQLSL